VDAGADGAYAQQACLNGFHVVLRFR
jgi:hypothetical protein